MQKVTGEQDKLLFFAHDRSEFMVREHGYYAVQAFAFCMLFRQTRAAQQRKKGADESRGRSTKDV